MSDMEKLEIRQRVLAMTDDEIEVVVRALPVEKMFTEVWRRYNDNEITLEKIKEAF